MEYELGLLLGS